MIKNFIDTTNYYPKQKPIIDYFRNMCNANKTFDFLIDKSINIFFEIGSFTGGGL